MSCFAMPTSDLFLWNGEPHLYESPTGSRILLNQEIAYPKILLSKSAIFGD